MSEFDDRPELIKKRARSIVLQRLVVALVSIFVVFALAILCYDALATRQTRAQLLSCTVPGELCYQQSQKRTAGVVQALIDANELDEVATRRIVIAATACADDPKNQTVLEVEACVEEVIAEEQAAKDK